MIKTIMTWTWHRILRRALDDEYFGQPDNKEVETKENVFISCACLCRNYVMTVVSQVATLEMGGGGGGEGATCNQV